MKDLRDLIGQYVYVRQGPRSRVFVQGEVESVDDEALWVWDRGATVRVDVESVYAVNVDTIYVE